MIFLWGIENNYVDITEICFHRYLFGDDIIIPESEEERLNLFGDPAPTIIKHIKVIDKFNSYKIFEGNNEIRINKDIIFGKKFLWGIENNYVDITEICFHRYLFGDDIIIPESEEERLSLFGDPAPITVKHIKVIDMYNNYKIFYGNNEIRINKDVIFEKKILLGIENNYEDITESCFHRYLFYNKLIINDQNLFNNNKHIKIIDSMESEKIFYKEDLPIIIDMYIDFGKNLNIFNIDYLYKKLYEYDRNISEEYIQKLEIYEDECTRNLNFDYMEDNIPDKDFTQSVFHDLLKFEKYWMKYSKLITIDILTNKSFSFKCLKSEKIFRTKKCFHQLVKNNINVSSSEYDDIIVYVFDQIDNPFFVAIGAGSCWMVLHTYILFIYYYKNDEIYFTKYFNHWQDKPEILCYNILNYYNNNVIEESSKINTIIGFSVNIAHEFWNDVSGFKFLLDMDLLKFIDRFIVGPYDYYNLHRYLEKNNYNFIFEYDIENINKLLENNTLLFKYNDIFMYDHLSKFVMDNNKYKNTDEINYINKIKSNHYPIITITLRAVYRYLHDQEDVLSNIINHLLILYPNIFIIFDGYIKNNNTRLNKCISNGFFSDSNIFDTSYNNIVNTIIKKINTQNYISLIGTSLERQIEWLKISDYGLLHAGAGSDNYRWLMNKKCIFMSRHLIISNKILVDFFHDFIYREKREFTTYINPNMIDFTTYKEQNNSFFIDWRIILLYIYKDLLILEKHKYKLSQFENLQYYDYNLTDIDSQFKIHNINIYNLLENDNIIENCNLIKNIINSPIFIPDIDVARL
jgi:hypothetical protein